MAVIFERAGFAAGLVLVAVGLGGCMGTTYGTGVDPGSQTLHDITGLVNIAGEKKAPIDYRPRPPIAAPPSVASLPPPGSAAVASASADWPKDPDEAAHARKVAAAKLHTGNAEVDAQYDPNIDLPVKQDKKINWNDSNTDTAAEQAAGSPAQDAETRKRILQAKSVVSVDANGNPIRKTLAEPPVVYLAPDPNAPTEFKSASQKLHWPWQKSQPDAKPAGLTDDSASAASDEKTTQ